MVVDTTQAESHRVFKTRIPSLRTPQTRDKFAPRHGQKGTMGRRQQNKLEAANFKAGKGRQLEEKGGV